MRCRYDHLSFHSRHTKRHLTASIDNRHVPTRILHSLDHLSPGTQVDPQMQYHRLVNPVEGAGSTVIGFSCLNDHLVGVINRYVIGNKVGE